MRQFPFLLIGLFCLASCGKQNPDSPKSPRIKNEKTTSVLSPKINQVVKIGEEVLFEIQAGDLSIDSVRIQVGSYSEMFTSGSFSWTPPTERTGTYKIQLSIYCNGIKEVHYRRLKLLSDIEPEQYSYIVLGAYPHNTNDYTQGLFFLNDQLIESTGQEKKSEIKKVDLITGETITKIPLDDHFFWGRVYGI